MVQSKSSNWSCCRPHQSEPPFLPSKLQDQRWLVTPVPDANVVGLVVGIVVVGVVVGSVVIFDVVGRVVGSVPELTLLWEALGIGSGRRKEYLTTEENKTIFEWNANTGVNGLKDEWKKLLTSSYDSFEPFPRMVKFVIPVWPEGQQHLLTGWDNLFFRSFVSAQSETEMQWFMTTISLKINLENKEFSYFLNFSHVLFLSNCTRN